jgi:hypothetical protein
MSDRCEPAEHLRGVEGFYWLYDIHTSARCPYIWNPRICRWKRFGGSHTRTPAQMRSDGWVYEAPVAPPDLVRALVEALEPFANATVLPTGAVVGMERGWFDTARAALRRAKEAGA